MPGLYLEILALEVRLRNLIGQWRRSADSLRESNPLWASHFYDCAAELEKVAFSYQNAEIEQAPPRWDVPGSWS